MGKLKNTLGKAAQKVIDRVMGNGLMQEETSASGTRNITEGFAELIRQAGAESCVLLKNDGVLPLDPQKEIAVFGRCQFDWFFVGYGSGGDVHAPYTVNLVDGLCQAGFRLNPYILNSYNNWTHEGGHKADEGWWGHWPTHHPEMQLSEELIQNARKTCDTAVIVIGRAAGEDRENSLTKGSYYLTDEEMDMLEKVTSVFAKTAVLLNIGNVIDMAWTRQYEEKISALMIVWQGGMESGNAVADVLCGKKSPSGKLSDTIAVNYEDYSSSGNFGHKEFNEYKEGIYVGYRHFDRFPEKVLYPFGYGLSYTDFRINPVSFDRKENKTVIKAEIVNTGTYTGKKAVLIWCFLPEGRIDKPRRVLAAFAKTKELKPQESEILEFTADDKSLASYDESEHAFVLEEGEYIFHAEDIPAGSFHIEKRETIEQCEPLLNDSTALRKRILERMPAELPENHNAITFEDVIEGKAALEEFIGTLSDRDLEALTRGHGMMSSVLGTPGNAGVFGGVTPSLKRKGVPAISTADGPSGLRLQKYCALIPCGTALACTWDTELIEQIGAKTAEEMIRCDVDVVLAPGMNIHRNPLCGRNFEYYSEDPLLSGKIAAAFIKGVQSKGKAACPKHFACNNQETRRNTHDSRLDERTLREIYLRNFEIAVREAEPLTIMTSYNKVNGVWSHYNYDLVTTVLRGEWGYDGCVITDWWMRRASSPEFPQLKNNAYRVRAQVDVLMPGDMRHTARKYRPDRSLLNTFGKEFGITRGELQRTAANVLRLAVRLNRKTETKEETL
ncbi:MAG: beta-glucosidase [Erysipelotrichaceae bacterium]|nr:beta-glucosidase [Erysipelotrichaceae bacterium]